MSEPTYEQAMAALRLLALEYASIYVSTLTEDGYWDSTGNGRIELEINCNDYFCPASDAETVEWSEVIPLLEALLKLEMKERQNFLMQWVADKRGVPNKSFKSK